MAGYIGSRAAVATSGVERKKTFAITTATTSLTGLDYTPNHVHVFHNGIRLVDGTDYTATNGTSITLVNAATNGDEVVVVSYGTFMPAGAYTKAEADAYFVHPNDDVTLGAVTAASFSGDGSGLMDLPAAVAKGDGTYKVFWENDQTVTTDYTITDGQNAMSAGPITVNDGVIVTIGDGEAWTIV